jgi:protein-tyrosine-phosphatase
MAAAIANAEIAQRLGIPFESLETVNVRALSAGVSARTGAPMTAEAEEVLQSLNVPVKPHAARSLTPELAERAELIFCMTSEHRQKVIEMLPSVAGKTCCLDLERDVDDPIGKGMPAYIACARRIQAAVQLRFNETRFGLITKSTNAPEAQER